MSKFLVYSLSDPRDNTVRYVGKSVNGLKRPRTHTYPSCLRKDKTYKGNWIRGLVNDGFKPEIDVLEELDTPEETAEAEQFWIASLKFMGFRLTNLTDGGEGRVGYKMSKEQREKLRLANLGNKHSLGKSQTLTAEQRQTRAEMARKRSADPTIQAKISATLTGRKQLPEIVAKRTAANKGKKHKPFSPETKRRQSEAAIRRWARERIS